MYISAAALSGLGMSRLAISAPPTGLSGWG